ncbi:MAG: UpxY family transcription antiterminator [Sphingobacteriales bacterium]|nr:MAG: UpxY family transcription antiterminator [Sphingobacteriales bacterium]
MLNDLDNYNWYPLYTKSRFEKKTNDILSKKGIKTYLPISKRLKQWSDRKKWVEEPLFQSYIFVHISAKEYELVIQTPGVVRFIYFSGKIACITNAQIEQLKKILAENYEPEVTFAKLEKGQKVKIIEGSLKGYQAEMVMWQKQSRLLLRIDALGQSLLLKIPAGFVCPI